MTPTNGTPGAAPTATFHARVAGVGLVTTLVVLIAACLTFMLQQWAVARTQSHQMYAGLAEMTAITAAPAIAVGNKTLIEAPVAALAASRNVAAARLTGLDGQVLAAYDRGAKLSAGVPTEVIRSDVVSHGRKIGALALVVRRPMPTA